MLLKQCKNVSRHVDTYHLILPFNKVCLSVLLQNTEGLSFAFDIVISKKRKWEEQNLKYNSNLSPYSLN